MSFSDRTYLALLASHGRAIAEAARQSSTAMVVIPSEPPGRNVCQFIRQIATSSSKTIVVGTPGRLAPGSLDRLLRASMPDVEKKLRVMDGSSDSVADAVRNAASNKLYSQSQALQVFCSKEQSDAFHHDVAGGALDFDPTTISVTPAEVPTDDADAITKAVSSGDEQSLHRVLDPHIFSSPEGMAQYRSAIGPSESFCRSIADRALVEFLKDIGTSREDGEAILANIVRRNAQLLKQRGVNTTGMKKLGSGNNGTAWQLSDGRVLKVTTDDAEAHVASHIKGKRMKHVFTIHDVWAFPGQYNGHIVYGLITEGGLQKPSEDERRAFYFMVMTLRSAYPAARDDLEAGRLKPVLDGLMRNQNVDRTEKGLALKFVKSFDLPGILDDVRKLGVTVDMHAGNFMTRPDGTYVIIDIGTGGDQESARPPLINAEFKNHHQVNIKSLHEFGTGSPGSGASGPPRMKGYNSSSWAGGRGVLKKQVNHVPEDENASERDGQLDTDITGGGLDWGKRTNLPS